MKFKATTIQHYKLYQDIEKVFDMDYVNQLEQGYVSYFDMGEKLQYTSIKLTDNIGESIFFYINMFGYLDSIQAPDDFKPVEESLPF